MYRIHVVAIALIGFLTPSLTLNQEAFAESSQSSHRSLGGVWKKTPVPFHGNKSGCHSGSDGSSNPPTPTEITLVQNGNSVSIRGKFASASGGYNSGGSGEVKGNQFTLTDSGGGFTVQYTGTISDDGKTITGQALCRYGSGSATATGSFTWTRKGETKRIKVWLTGFIPTDKADLLPFVPALWNTPRVPLLNSRCHAGDNRPFSNQITENRFRFRHNAELEVEVQGSKVTRIISAKDDPLTNPSHFVNCKNPQQILQTSEENASTAGMKFQSELVGNAIKVVFSGSVRHGILKEASPAIDYNIQAIIDPINEKPVSVVGGRNRYPAYEMYMQVQKQSEPEGSVITLLQQPPDGTKTPWGLFGKPNTPVTPPGSDFGSEGGKAGEWFGEQAGQDAAEDIFKNPNNSSPSTPPFDGFGGGDSGSGGSSTLW